MFLVLNSALVIKTSLVVLNPVFSAAALFAQITLCLQPIVFNIDEMCNTNHSVLSFHYFLSALDKLNKSVDVKNNNNLYLNLNLILTLRVFTERA